MKVRREVHSLDYAVCVLVSLLDRVFHGFVEWWDVSHGLNLEIVDRQEDRSKDVLVAISPVGWQKDENICARFRMGPGGWYAFEGSVNSPRLPNPLGTQFVFQVSWPFSIESQGTREQQFLASVRV